MKLDGILEKSEFYIPYFSRYCAQIDREAKSETKNSLLDVKTGHGGKP